MVISLQGLLILCLEVTSIPSSHALSCFDDERAPEIKKCPEIDTQLVFPNTTILHVVRLELFSSKSIRFQHVDLSYSPASEELCAHFQRRTSCIHDYSWNRVTRIELATNGQSEGSLDFTKESNSSEYSSDLIIQLKELDFQIYKLYFYNQTTCLGMK